MKRGQQPQKGVINSSREGCLREANHDAVQEALSLALAGRRVKGRERERGEGREGERERAGCCARGKQAMMLPRKPSSLGVGQTACIGSHGS